MASKKQNYVYFMVGVGVTEGTILVIYSKMSIAMTEISFIQGSMSLAVCFLFSIGYWIALLTVKKWRNIQE